MQLYLTICVLGWLLLSQGGPTPLLPVVGLSPSGSCRGLLLAGVSFLFLHLLDLISLPLAISDCQWWLHVDFLLTFQFSFHVMTSNC